MRWFLALLFFTCGLVWSFFGSAERPHEAPTLSTLQEPQREELYAAMEQLAAAHVPTPDLQRSPASFIPVKAVLDDPELGRAKIFLSRLDQETSPEAHNAIFRAHLEELKAEPEKGWREIHAVLNHLSLQEMPAQYLSYLHLASGMPSSDAEVTKLAFQGLSRMPSEADPNIKIILFQILAKHSTDAQTLQSQTQELARLHPELADKFNEMKRSRNLE